MRPSLLALCLIAACDFHPLASGDADPANPLERYATVEFSPDTLPYYREWWSDMERCSGLTGEFVAVRWFMLRDSLALTFQSAGRAAAATWVQESNAILLTQVRLFDQHIVSHEMLHALLQQRGHPAAFDTCGIRLGAPRD